VTPAGEKIVSFKRGLLTTFLPWAGDHIEKSARYASSGGTFITLAPASRHGHTKYSLETKSKSLLHIIEFAMFLCYH